MIRISEKLGIYERQSGRGLHKNRDFKRYGSKNLAFRMNLQENCLRKGKT